MGNKKKAVEQKRYCKEARIYSMYGNCGSPIEGDGEMCARCVADKAAEAKRKAEPIKVFNDRELATVLHGLRIIQELRSPVEAGCEDAERRGETGSESLNSCDHFSDCHVLTDEEIDWLCERLNLGPEKPKPYVPNAVELGFIEYARQHIATDEIEIDDGPDCKGNYPKVSQGADGAFVAAWVWVSNEQAGVEEVEPLPAGVGVHERNDLPTAEQLKARAGIIPHDPLDDEPEEFL